jgi:hypothetical protein
VQGSWATWEGAKDQSKPQSPFPQAPGCGSFHPAAGVGGCLRVEERGNRRLIHPRGGLPRGAQRLLPLGRVSREGWRVLGWQDPSGQREARDPRGYEDGAGRG